jgi:hypothetical protein
MLKLRSAMEDVAEKLFGRFLPQVEAKANDCQWRYGCCDEGGILRFLSYQQCQTPPYIRDLTCSGHCPT